MADKVFNFNDQRRIGDIGESDFVRVYKKLKPKKSKTNFQIDFTLSNGKTVELKTDSYDMEKTPNFFMEQKTISEKSSNLGGPWRAKDHKIDYFVYYFLKNKVFFWYDPIPLCEFLDKFVKESNNAKLGSIMQSFLTYLLSSRPVIKEKERTNIIQFLTDIPIDTAAIFVTEIDGKERGSQEFLYASKLHVEMSKDKKYKEEFYERMVAAGKKASSIAQK